MLAKPDIKGALAHSTIGQMGFMIMTCGLGAFAAAVFHLVAHGMYKASLFLGSGAAVHRHVRHTKAPPRSIASQAPAATACPVRRRCRRRRGAGARYGRWIWMFARREWQWCVARVRLVTAAAATWGILRRRLSFGVQAACLAGVFTATWAYEAWLRVFTRFLSVDLGTVAQNPAAPWLLALLVAVLALVAITRLAGAGRRLRCRTRTGTCSRSPLDTVVRRRRAPRQRFRRGRAVVQWVGPLETGSEAAGS